MCAFVCSFRIFFYIDDGTKDDGHNAIWVAHEFPVHACDRAEDDGPNASACCCIFPCESKQECGEWASGSHGESKYEHRNDGFAYKGDNDGDDAEEQNA